jgi:hypothetical protein
MDAPTLEFSIFPKVASPNVLGGKVLAHNTESTLPDQRFKLFDECAVVDIPEIESKMLSSVSVMGEKNS